jgi:hypothetical protein
MHFAPRIGISAWTAKTGKDKRELSYLLGMVYTLYSCCSGNISRALMVDFGSLYETMKLLLHWVCLFRGGTLTEGQCLLGALLARGITNLQYFLVMNGPVLDGLP